MTIHDATADTGSRDDQPPDEFVASLYRAHAVALIRIALMLVGDQHSAEDVVQDASAVTIPRHRSRRSRRAISRVIIPLAAASAVAIVAIAMAVIIRS